MKETQEQTSTTNFKRQKAMKKDIKRIQERGIEKRKRRSNT